MVRIPKVIGLTLCDHIDIDPHTGQFSLVGVFHARYFRQFPSPAVAFTVYAALYGGRGEGTIEVKVNRAETETDIYRLQKWFSLPSRQLVNAELKVKRCVFPEPGRYLISLRFDGQDLTTRFLDARRE